MSLRQTTCLPDALGQHSILVPSMTMTAPLRTQAAPVHVVRLMGACNGWVRRKQTPRKHLDGVRGVNGDLVVRLIPVRQPQVVVLDLEVHIRQDQLRKDKTLSTCMPLTVRTSRQMPHADARMCDAAQPCTRTAAPPVAQQASAHLLLDLLPDDSAGHGHCLSGLVRSKAGL